MDNYIVKSEIKQLLPIPFLIIAQLVLSDFHWLLIGEMYALLSVFFLRITYIHLKKKNKLDAFLAYIINFYLLINLILGFTLMHYEIFIPAVMGFLAMVFLYSVLLSIIPKQSESLASIIRRNHTKE